MDIELTQTITSSNNNIDDFDDLLFDVVNPGVNFQVTKVEKKSPLGEVTLEDQLMFSTLIDPKIMKTLVDITDNEKFYDETTTVSPGYLFQYYEEISKRVQAGNESLISLACYLADHFKDKINQYNKMSEDGRITFDHLSNVFHVGTRFVAYTTNNQLVGSIVHNTNVQRGPYGEKYFVITGIATVSNGKEFIQIDKQYTISEFHGLQYVKDLQIRPMNDEEYKYLTERGKKFVKYGLNTHYLAYEGEMFKQSMYGPVHFNAVGRLMIDAVGFKIQNPNYERSYHQNKNVCVPDIPEELLYMTWPFLSGFSFVAKQWGEIYVDKLKEIKYDDNAFDYLVLNPEYKEMAKALVTNVNYSFSDIIQGKSGGCIFLLYGLPGTGKTLTAESISELLHKPLYSISVGELGTTTDTLEKKLSTILEIANSWSAVILIDECDIFLEKRTNNDIDRNAMTAIFLRLLERHQGVLFLTTNRVESLDEAFRSRISVIIKYDELDKVSRTQIWKNLLKAANVDIDTKTIDLLSEVKTTDDKHINGRQIKNAIRMAQCIAHNKRESVTYDHLVRVIKMM